MSLWFAKIPKEEYINRNIVWVPLCTDVQRQTLFLDTFAGIRLICYENIDTNLLKETYEKIFNDIIIMLNEKHNFCIDEYKSFRHNLMKNDEFIKNDQIVHRDYKIVKLFIYYFNNYIYLFCYHYNIIIIYLYISNNWWTESEIS